MKIYPADILLPDFCAVDGKKWACVACDQYTSEPEYWESVAKNVKDSPSTLNLMLPEVWLGESDMRVPPIQAAMNKYLSDGVLAEHKSSAVYLERIQSDGKLRRGLVCAIDLDDYDFSVGSSSPIRPTEKTVFFYGDSITEGIRALNMSASSKGNSATNSYAWQCAEALGVTPYLIGYGATGILSQGSFHTMRNAIDYLSEGRPADGTVIPDIIVVNHGTNDGKYDAETFRDALAETLAHLRKKYPEAPIVYLIPFCGAHADTIASVVEGMENAFTVRTDGWDIPCTDSLHPNAAGAKKAGGLLADALRERFGDDYFRNTDQGSFESSYRYFSNKP